MSDSVRPHRWQPTRLLRPWDSPGKNAGVGCHFLLQGIKVKSESEVAQSCPTLSDTMDCSPPGPSVHGIFQARVLEWGVIAFSVAAAAAAKSLQSCLTLCSPIDGSPPGSPVPGTRYGPRDQQNWAVYCSLIVPHFFIYGITSSLDSGRNCLGSSWLSMTEPKDCEV